MIVFLGSEVKAETASRPGAAIRNIVDFDLGALVEGRGMPVRPAPSSDRRFAVDQMNPSCSASV